MTLIAALGAAVLMALGFLLRKPNPLAYWVGIAFLFGTILMTFFDQVGVADVVFMLINLLPLGLLIRRRSWCLQRPTA